MVLNTRLVVSHTTCFRNVRGSAITVAATVSNKPAVNVRMNLFSENFKYSTNFFCAQEILPSRTLSAIYTTLQGFTVNTRHYYVLNLDPRTKEVFEFIQHHKLKVEVHLNRTRFWIPEGAVLTELLLRFSECVHHVDDSLDLATGRPI